jgi:hypothetical protein
LKTGFLRTGNREANLDLNQNGKLQFSIEGNNLECVVLQYFSTRSFGAGDEIQTHDLNLGNGEFAVSEMVTKFNVIEHY